MTIQNDFYTANGAPGLAVSQFFTGLTPTQARFEALSVEVAKQEASYGASGVKYPELAGYEALGKGFAIAYPSAVDITVASRPFFGAAYEKAFGHLGYSAQVDHFIAQETYFKGIYAAAGFSASDAAIQARGAALGQLIGAAVADASTPLGKGVAAFYADASDGNVTYGKPLGDYKPDTVTVEVPGPSVPGPVVDKADVVVQSFGSVAAIHANGSNGLLFGDGTTANAGLQTVVDPTSGITIGVGVSPRQSVEGNYRPDKVVFDGVTLTVDHKLPSGAQDDANGSQADNANRGANSFSFTFGNDKMNLVDFIEAGGKLVIGIDRDPTAGIDRLALTAFKAGDGTIDFKDASGLIQITDSGGNANTVANSQQQNFYLPTGVAALTPGSQFSNSFEVFDAGGVKLVGIVENLALGATGFSPFDQTT